jgi:hypothetical protein
MGCFGVRSSEGDGDELADVVSVPVVPESGVSADDTAVPVSTAAPIARANANPPTRPIHRA